MAYVYRNYKKDEIAARMLDTALDLYFEGGDGFSIIHLSAAAEEVLAGLIENTTRSEDGTSCHTARKKSIATLEEIHRILGTDRTEKQIGTCLNLVKNKIKHHDSVHEHIEFPACVELEVEMSINRAVENYSIYFGNPTEKMVRCINSICGIKGTGNIRIARAA
jgi:hypothetical protein